MSSMPPPMQVLPVMPPYQSFPQYPQRPGVVTAVGVIGIIVSVLSMISAPVIAMLALTSLITIQAQRQWGSANDPMLYPWVPDADVVSAPDGLDAQKAGFVVEALTRTRPLTATRAMHVRSLALMHGKQLFPFGAEGMTVLRMKSNISESGPLLAGVGKTGDYYVTGAGRIEVTDQSAIFRPDNGPTARSDDVVVDRSLTEDQIDAALVRIQSLAQLQLSEPQSSTIRRLLRDPQQSVITRPDDTASAPNVSAAGPMQNGGVWFTTEKSQIRITDAGVETLLNTLAPTPGTNPVTGKPAQSIWSQMVLVVQLVSLGLAIVLMVGSVGLLRGKPSARKLTLIWAMIKVPVVVIGSLMLGLMTTEWFAMLPQNGGMSASPSVPGLIGGIIGGLVGIAWPVGVLVVINRKSIKDWVAMTR